MMIVVDRRHEGSLMSVYIFKAPHFSGVRTKQWRPH
jgi:hypothetical protein